MKCALSLNFRCGWDRSGGCYAGSAYKHGTAWGSGIQAVWDPRQAHYLHWHCPHCHKGNWHQCNFQSKLIQNKRRAENVWLCQGWTSASVAFADVIIWHGPFSRLCRQHLRQVGVVGKFVEFFGPGVAQLSIADRATIANMCPEYGATAAFFPVDDVSIQYLEQTGEGQAARRPTVISWAARLTWYENWQHYQCAHNLVFHHLYVFSTCQCTNIPHINSVTYSRAAELNCIVE